MIAILGTRDPSKLLAMSSELIMVKQQLSFYVEAIFKVGAFVHQNTVAAETRQRCDTESLTCECSIALTLIARYETSARTCIDRRTKSALDGGSLLLSSRHLMSASMNCREERNVVTMAVLADSTCSQT